MARFKPSVFEEDKTSWERQESRIARETGGKQQRGSGSSDYAKGDVKGEKFLIECKFTQKKSLSVKGDWLKKITKEAHAQDKYPALAIQIAGTEDLGISETDWVAIPMSLFNRIKDLID